MFSGKVAVITGASRGIGRALAEAFAKSGATVYAVSRDKQRLEELAGQTCGICPIEADVRKADELKQIMASIYKEQGHIDILVNNAGIMEDSLIGMISDESMREMFETNVFALIHLSQIAARLMKRKKSGSIINIASAVGLYGNEGQAVYSATKGAVIAFTKSAAKELASDGIRVNAIAPGVIDTDLLNGLPEEKLQEKVSKIKMGHMGRPEDVAEAALFLASDKSGYITGQILPVDGMIAL